MADEVNDALSRLISGRSCARLGRIVRTDEFRLILTPVLRLAECKSAVPAHPLDGTDFFDRLLESEVTRVSTS
jgi:hypothetical protein